GEVSHEWRIKKLTISDATGNRWSPYLSFSGPDAWNWTTNGVVEFFGALWPSEQAWKLQLELLTADGSPSADQRSRFVEFRARPEFAPPHSLRGREESTITKP